jgi:hypothetical protein
MGNDLFGVDIAGIIADAMADGLFPVTVTRYTAGARNPADLTGGRPRTPATVEGISGFWDDFTSTPPPGVVLELNDRKLVLIGDTIPVGGEPRYNDAVVVHEPMGDVGPLYVVKRLSRDPANAAPTYLCRDRRGPDQV